MSSPASSPASGLLLYCRPGFEKECAAEILAQTSALGSPGYVRATPDGGLVEWLSVSAERNLADRLRFDDLIFARQLLWVLGRCEELSPADRLSPLLALIRQTGRRFSELLLETADTNEAKSLAILLRKFAMPLRQALQRECWLGHPGQPRLHVFFRSGTAAIVALSQPGNASPWPLGIPRLKFPRGAPSRSTLKLDEAFRVFVRHPERDLGPGLTAVDLGAAPGGWTWQLVHRHIRTVAVDNGALDPALLDSGIVEHLRVDGFRYRPPKPVDWLVCDMVEQPTRIAALVADWLANGHCRQAIFNLKLPMKKRYETVLDCRGLIEARLAATGLPCRLRFKQLYHDRAEITGHADIRGPLP